MENKKRWKTDVDEIRTKLNRLSKERAYESTPHNCMIKREHPSKNIISVKLCHPSEIPEEIKLENMRFWKKQLETLMTKYEDNVRQI